MSEPTLTDKIIAVAEWDGKVVYAKYCNRKKDKGNSISLRKCTYHTSLDSIAPVALKVMDELYKLPNDKVGTMYELHISKNSIRLASISLDPLQIFNATYEAIQLLKRYQS